MKYVKEITLAVRLADDDFEKVGGSSRHWVRECLIPRLEEQGLVLVKLTDMAKLNTLGPCTLSDVEGKDCPSCCPKYPR